MSPEVHGSFSAGRYEAETSDLQSCNTADREQVRDQQAEY